jgi:tRNA (guanine-N7-)-methyltransferase
MHRTIKSYVLRKGRISHRQQQGLSVWLKDYELLLGDMLWSFSEIFGNHADTVVEIGFGMGHSLFLQAQNNPELNYIGIEVHEAGVGSLVADLHDFNVPNVRVVVHDAVEVFHTQIPDNSLAGIQIFFPDPWHKKRHHKRRLIQPELIRLLVSKLKPGGFIHCATDWQEYADHILNVLSAAPQLNNKQSDGGYAPRPSSRPLTRFELRGERLGHGVWDLIFFKEVISLA